LTISSDIGNRWPESSRTVRTHRPKPHSELNAAAGGLRPSGVQMPREKSAPLDEFHCILRPDWRPAEPEGHLLARVVDDPQVGPRMTNRSLSRVLRIAWAISRGPAAAPIGASAPAPSRSGLITPNAANKDTLEASWSSFVSPPRAAVRPYLGRSPMAPRVAAEGCAGALDARPLRIVPRVPLLPLRLHPVHSRETIEVVVGAPGRLWKRQRQVSGPAWLAASYHPRCRGLFRGRFSPPGDRYIGSLPPMMRDRGPSIQ
jgi:hypothetical protein